MIVRTTGYGITIVGVAAWVLAAVGVAVMLGGGLDGGGNFKGGGNFGGRVLAAPSPVLAGEGSEACDALADEDLEEDSAHPLRGCLESLYEMVLREGVLGGEGVLLREREEAFGEGLLDQDVVALEGMSTEALALASLQDPMLFGAVGLGLTGGKIHLTRGLLQTMLRRSGSAWLWSVTALGAVVLAFLHRYPALRSSAAFESSSWMLMTHEGVLLHQSLPSQRSGRVHHGLRVGEILQGEGGPEQDHKVYLPYLRRKHDEALFIKDRYTLTVSPEDQVFARVPRDQNAYVLTKYLEVLRDVVRTKESHYLRLVRAGQIRQKLLQRGGKRARKDWERMVSMLVWESASGGVGKGKKARQARQQLSVWDPHYEREVYIPRLRQLYEKAEEKWGVHRRKIDQRLQQGQEVEATEWQLLRERDKKKRYVMNLLLAADDRQSVFERLLVLRRGGVNRSVLDVKLEDALEEWMVLVQDAVIFAP